MALFFIRKRELKTGVKDGGRQRASFRQGTDFSSNHYKVATGHTSAGRLDGGVQCEQIGLAGSAADEVENSIDMRRMVDKDVDCWAA